MKKYEIKLTLNELELLDTKVSEEAQKVINDAKQENSFGFELPLMNEILKKSLEIGKLTWIYDNMRSCKYCDKDYDYKAYPKSSRYHSKGDSNFDKPIHYRGLKFNAGFVRVSNNADICCDCAEKHDIIHKLIDYIIDNDLPIEIQKNDYKPSKYLKDDIEICYECSKEMQESQMGLLPAVMEGYYRGECPHCGAKSKAFGNNHETTNKFVMVPNPLAKEEIVELQKVIEKFNDVTEDNYKVNLIQNKYHLNNFYIQEKEWKNGHNNIIVINTDKKTYKKEYWFKDIHKDFEELLIKYNYKLLEEE